MKNIGKLMATILIITFGLSFIGSIRTYSEDVFWGDGTETFVSGRSPSIIERRLQKLNSDPPFNIVDALTQTEGSDEKTFILSYFLQNFIEEKSSKKGVVPPIPSSFDINDFRIKEAVSSILKATGVGDPFALNRCLLACSNRFTFLKIIYDFETSEKLSDEDKSKILNSCELFKDIETLDLINSFYQTYIL